jgi:hypothetical protein
VHIEGAPARGGWTCSRAVVVGSSRYERMQGTCGGGGRDGGGGGGGDGTRALRGRCVRGLAAAHATPRRPSPSAPTTRHGGASAADSITTQSGLVRKREAGVVTTRSSCVREQFALISSRRSNT